MVRAVRRRYVALVAEGEAPPPAQLEARVLAEVRRRMPAALQAQVRPRLYHLRPGAAIVRVDPSTQRAVVAALQGLAVGGARLRTVTTSGTLRQAKRALGVRASARRRARPRRPRGAPGGGAAHRRPPPNS